MITHLNEKLIAVEVPSDANDFKLYFEFGHTRISYNSISETEMPITKYTFQNIILNSETLFKILGEVDADNISFDVEPYVEKTKHYTWGGYGYAKTEDVFVNYQDRGLSIKRTANESFITLLESKGIETNKPNVKHVILKKLKQ